MLGADTLLKRYSMFIALLLGMNFILSTYTFGVSSAAVEIVGLFSLRPKHWILFTILALPQEIINMAQYGGFWESAGTATASTLDHGLRFAFNSQLGSLGVMAGINSVYGMYVTYAWFRLGKVKDTAHKLNIYSKLYQVPPRFVTKRKTWDNRVEFGIRLLMVASAIGFLIILIPDYKAVLFQWPLVHLNQVCPYLGTGPIDRHALGACQAALKKAG